MSESRDMETHRHRWPAWIGAAILLAGAGVHTFLGTPFVKAQLLPARLEIEGGLLAVWLIMGLQSAYMAVIAGQEAASTHPRGTVLLLTGATALGMAALALWYLRVVLHPAPLMYGAAGVALVLAAGLAQRERGA